MHCKTTEPKTSVQLKREDGGSALPFQSLEPHWVLRSMLCQEALGDLPPVAKKKEKERIYNPIYPCILSTHKACLDRISVIVNILSISINITIFGSNRWVSSGSSLWIPQAPAQGLNDHQHDQHDHHQKHPEEA